MKRAIIITMILILVFSTVVYSEELSVIKFSGSIITEGPSSLYLVYSDDFKIAWLSDVDAVSYDVSFSSSNLELNENVTATEFQVKGLLENDRGFFTVKGLDKSGNIISQSPQLIVAHPPSESMSLSLEKPSNNVLSKVNYDDFFESNFSFNYVSGMERFRIKIFSGDKVYRDRLQLINMGTFPKELDDGLDKKLTVEVSAVVGDKVITTESFEIEYYNDVKSNYNLDVIGYDQNKPYWSNTIRIDMVDNHNDLDDSESTYYKAVIKNNDSGVIKSLVTSISNSSYNNAYISTILDNGGYDVSVEAIKPLTYKGGFDIYQGHSLDELMENIETSETLGRDTLHIEVLGGSSAIYAPSMWARESIDNIVGYIPNELNNTYDKAISRQEVCRVLVPLYENFSSGYTVPRTGIFKDTDDPYVSVAYLKDIVKGKSSDTFDPNGNITREEFAVIASNICRSLGYEIDDTTQSSFKDNGNISSWAQSSVNYLASIKVFNGSTDGKFNPKSSITRGEAYVVANNLLNYLNSKLEY